jgi:hypothetical protein
MWLYWRKAARGTRNTLAALLIANEIFKRPTIPLPFTAALHPIRAISKIEWRT